jgi:hypothetical protein
MDWAQFGLNAIVTWGAGIAALLLVFGTIVAVLWKLPKFFKAWQEMVKESNEERRVQLKAIADLSSKNSELTAMTAEVVRANTLAFQDNCKSNENTSKSLDLLAVMYDRSERDSKIHDERMAKLMGDLTKTIADHDVRAQAIAITLASVNERTSACRTRRDDPK